MNISQVYNYLNHDLVPKRRTRTHKASELKAVYNSISKYNQSSPLYLVSLSESRQEHMIDIKEQALTLRDITDQLANPDSELYTKKQIFTDHPDAVILVLSVHMRLAELPDHMTLQIDQLPTSSNVGTYLIPTARHLHRAATASPCRRYMAISHLHCLFPVLIQTCLCRNSLPIRSTAGILMYALLL